MQRGRRLQAAAGVVASVVVVVVVAACGSDAAEPTPQEYLADLEAICADTTAALDRLPDPPDQITVADFATSAAGLLENEAEHARALDPPSELAQDHRAFVLNTDEQAARWRDLAAGTGDLAAQTTTIAQLLLGRDDLATEMGADGCRRGAG